MKRTNKLFAVLSSIVLVTGQFTPMALAFDAPAAPTAPEAPTAPTAPAAPTAPEAPTAPTAPAPASPESTYTPPEAVVAPTGQNQPPAEESIPAPVGETQQTGGQIDGGNVGDTGIVTGDANSTAALSTDANTNSAAVASGQGGTGGGISIANTGNGSGSQNSGSATLSNITDTNQTNSATVINNLSQESNTGDNTSSKNVGNTAITTGDANTSGTIITSVNTNIAGLMVSEFNVADDHVGDIILDFAAGCVTGCAGGSSSLANTDNGANSTNTSTLDVTTSDNTFQSNDATVLNTMILDANSGGNTADKNTGGDSAITTGDANITANLLTFVNNNVAGDVVYGVVNIYGDLFGDIIFPESEFTNCCGSSATLANTGNGANSTNTTTLNSSVTDTSAQTNLANIDNTLLIDATTGGNETSKNTGGDNTIKTGSSNVDAQVINIANTNVDGGNWWLVLVNEAGKWIGRIIGADGNYAGSTGTEFSVNESGEISVTNSGNGAGSTNTATLNQDSSTTTTQANTAHVVNNVTLDANTGGNSASKNTGGNNSIATGDANVIANIVNFVNNNIIGGGKLFVTVVNVFGSWTGNFLPPGFQKPIAQSAPIQAVGGSEIIASQATSESHTNAPSSTGATADGNVLTYALGNKSGTRSSGSFNAAMVLASTITNPQDGVQTAVAAKKVLQINLAWLILLLPCAILLFALKKMRKTQTQ